MKLAMYCLVTLILMSTSIFANELPFISFHKVEEICQGCDVDKFEQGKEVFPAYKLHWLPDNFRIKMAPDERFTSFEISSIIVEQITISEKPNNYLISVELLESANEKFLHYAQNNAGTKAAIKINSNILNIINILPSLEGNEFTFVVRNIEKKELFKILKSLSVAIKEKE